MLHPSSPSARTLAALLALGAGFLTWRAVFLLSAGYGARYVAWLAGFTVVELILAVMILGLALGWTASGAAAPARWTLRLTAALILLHAFRVAVFALARIGPWPDFDLRPAHRPMAPDAWSMFDVWFASGMAALSLLALAGVLVWRHRPRLG